MSCFKVAGICVVVSAVLAVGGVACADDLDYAQGYVDSIREADPPQVSTTTYKEDPSGQPISDYKPTGPSVHATEPPSPVNSNNPQNDPDVQAGYDAHQKWYYGN